MGKNEDQIAIYSRKSRFTGKGESIGNQIELCREYVKTMYGEPYMDRCAVFEDEGFSGGDLKRPDFQRMMEQVRQRRFRAIVVYRLDRISRNISDFAGLIDELTKLDVDFVSIREQFDTGTPMGRAMMFIISVFSQLERETIAQRIRDNMQELAKTGRWLGGNYPTGFASESVSNVTVDGKTRKSCRLKLIPGEAETVRVIFDLYRETDSLTATEAELLRRRLKTKTGRDFSRFSIKTILQNPVYMTADETAYLYFSGKAADVCSPKGRFDGSCGIMAYNRTEQEKGKTTILLPVCDWIIAVGQHPGLIPSGHWIAVQQSLERNRSGAYRKARSNEALLTGLLFCSCGNRMYPKQSGRKTAKGKPVCVYVCKMKERSKGQRCKGRNVSGNALDEAVMEQIRILRENRQSFAAQMEKTRQFYTGNREAAEWGLGDLRTEHAQNERIMEGLIDSLAVLQETAAKEYAVRRMEKLSQTNRQIEGRIRELESLAAASGLSEAEFDLLKRKLAQFSGCVDGMALEEKRAALRSLVSRVIWDGENAHLILAGADDADMAACDLPETHWR